MNAFDETLLTALESIALSQATRSKWIAPYKFASTSTPGFDPRFAGAARILVRAGMLVRLDSASPYYEIGPYKDEIHMPKSLQFPTLAHFYATLFHEMAHATGHPARLGRPLYSAPELVAGMLGTVVSTPELRARLRMLYATEEVAAELASLHVCRTLGIATEEILANSGAYLRAWVNRGGQFREALPMAHAAAEWLLNRGRDVK